MNETPIEHELQLSAQPSSQPEHQAKSGWIHCRRLLLFLLGFFLSAAVLGLIFFIQQSLQTRSNTNNPVASCLALECQLASARLSMSVDPFKRPCDYFLLTCGSDRPSSATGDPQKVKGSVGHQQRKRKREVRPQRRTVDRKTPLLEYLRDILESNGSLTSSAVKKAKGFYRSCLDTRSIETAGVEPFLTLIEKVGGWPVSGNWNRTDFNSTLSLIMRDYATFPFFNLFVGKDPTEISSGAKKKYIQIDQPDLLIPIEWNRKTQKSQAKTETLRPFLATCHRYLALLGGPPSTSMMHVGMFISLSSELAVAAAPLHHRQSEGQLNQRMTIEELQVQAPAINWLHCLQAVFHPQPITQQDQVLLHNMPYIVQMSQIIAKWLNKHELRSSGTLQTYMVFYLLHTLMPALDSRFSETASDLSVALGNTDEVAPRWKRCVLETEKGFDSVLTHLLNERMAHREAEEMIQDIFSSLKSKLFDIKSTDQTTYQLVVSQVESLLPRLWTMREISGEPELDLLFSEVALSNHSFFSNYIQLLSLWQKRRSKQLDPRDVIDILSVTPFLREKELLFPMGMFVPPLFHPNYPRAMNYGALGFLIARDILRLLLPDTLSDSVRDVGECVWTHYVTATEKAGGISLSAAQQQEVWLQYSALQIALQAYHQSLTKRPDDTSVSGFSHTGLFLRSFSRVNCDSDPHRDLMPLEPSFLITVICAKSGLCPSNLNCPNRTQAHSSPVC